MKKHENRFNYDEVQAKWNRERYLLDSKIVALQCTTCKDAFELDRFNKLKGGIAGKLNKCKVCHSQHSNQWQKENSEQVKARFKRHYEGNKFYFLTRDHNKRSNKAGLPTNLTIMDVDMLFAIAGSIDANQARCMITGLWTDIPHIAHVIPRAKKGETSMRNLIIVDASVNLKQGTMHLLDWLMTGGAVEVASKEYVQWTVEYLAQQNCKSIRGYLNDELGWDKANSFYDTWIADELEPLYSEGFQIAF